MSNNADVFRDLLQLAVESGASDVVVKAGKPGHVRLLGQLKPVDMDPIANDEVTAFVAASMPANLKARWLADGQVDFALDADGIGRFRVNAFHQRGLCSIVFRHVKNRVPSLEELKLNADALTNLVKPRDGIVLVCGATGSGKSSTLAAMLNWVNKNQDRHVVTLEDPIEYTFQDEKSVFQQREIGLDVPSFELAITSVLRQNPDIIFIGEMRDRVTFETAISAAETGHLVLSTMHAGTVSQAVTRLFEFFPGDQQAQARRQISGTLRGIICQKLIPAIEGGGRVPANEILTADSVARALIQDGQFEKIQGLLEGGDALSFNFNRDIYRLVKSGAISKADGLRASPNPQALEMNLKGIFFK